MLLVTVVDPRTVVNPAQVRRLINAVATAGRTRGPHLKALFACMYYAALRPEEGAGLWRELCAQRKGRTFGGRAVRPEEVADLRRENCILA